VCVFSSPTHLGAFLVAADGTVTVTLPSSLAPGAHRIAVYAADGSVIGWDWITVLAASSPTGLASTGAEVSGALAAALLLLVFGAAAIGRGAAARPRRQRSVPGTISM